LSSLGCCSATAFAVMLNIWRFFPGVSDFFYAGKGKSNSSDCNQEVNLMKFRELPIGPLSKGNEPAPRSGHRIFLDDEFLYVVGGFDRTADEQGGKIYREVWRYNLLTQEWTEMDLIGNFPTALASFACESPMLHKFIFCEKFLPSSPGWFALVVQSSPYSNQVVLFGGTAVPFGASTSSSVHLLSFSKTSNSILSTLLPVEGEKLATYGHAMLRGSDPCAFYVIGGTTGHNFFLDVDKLTFEEGKWKWSSEAQATPNLEGRYRLEAVAHDDLIFLFGGGRSATPNLEGRYRLEAVAHDDLIFLFGGGRPDYVTELRTITVFDTKKKMFVELPTLPDESINSQSWEDGYPKGRRCHSVTKWKKKAILVGGCSADKDDDDVRHVDMYSDVWSFDLETYQWKKMPFDLAVPVFFHDAAITKEGCLLVWGGVRDIYSSHRTNIGQYCYLEPPSLKTLAALSLRPYIYYKSMALSLLSQNRCSFGGCQLNFSSTDDLIAHIEFTHIPPLEEEYRQKASQAQSGPEENRASATPNMPLSCVYRLFQPAYNPTPCDPDVIRLTFNHYRKRPNESGSSNVQSLSSSLRKDESNTGDCVEDLSECSINDLEERFRCHVAECGKRFRSASGLRSRPYKCQQCSKRYKTTAGLSNHVEQSHKKQSGGCGTPSSTDSAPASPSPAVLDQLISQARAHGQATAAAAQEQQRAQQRPLPVQVASATGHQYGQMSAQPPLPVRSIPNTHSRYTQGHVQRVASCSPLQGHQSNTETNRNAATDTDESSRVYNTPHVVESGPILLPPKQD
uniref:Kelch domain-containing protein 10 n=1 Tax=Haemonchus placei TaxID=6290 RepID=A0A0N4WUK8_HAEPC